MKLATVIHNGETSAAIAIDGNFWSLMWPDVGAMLADNALSKDLKPAQRLGAMDSVAHAPLIPKPGKIICTGINYLPHINELGVTPPTHPTLFSKYHTALTGPRDDLSLFDKSAAIDWEAELVVVIGNRISSATGKEAENAIAGFCIGNDVSARDLQLRTDQWLAGKTLDGSTPLGPWLVTGDEVGIRPDLEISCKVNDRIVQQARTSELLFDAVDLIVDISAFCTLEPGDLIFTGTPGGIGAARDPQWFLKPGDILTTEIESLGICVNRCVA